MAGNYADPPDLRMALDRDGSSAFQITKANAVVALSASDAQALNDEADATFFQGENATAGGQGNRFGWLFPQARTIRGYFIAAVGTQVPWVALALETSTNTTTGLDGSWTQRAASPVFSGASSPNYRSAAQAISAVSSVKGIRFLFQAGPGATAATEKILAFHVFGDRGVAAGDYLLLWDKTLNQQITGAYFDWGNMRPSSSRTRQFRVKNLSATKTANSVAVTVEALTPGSPDMSAMMLFSLDGVTFSASVNVGNIGPASISPVVYARMNVNASAPVGPWAQRIVATAASFV